MGNKIHVSDAVNVRLADDYEFEDGGKIELKGKGLMQSWFLVDRKEGRLASRLAMMRWLVGVESFSRVSEGR